VVGILFFSVSGPFLRSERISMKKIILIIALAAILGLVGVRLYDELAPGASSSSNTPDLPQRPTMLVETANAQPHLFHSRLEILGELLPWASVNVMSKISGRLEKVLVERGDPVRQGQLLAVVDDEGLQQLIRRAEASIGVARAAVNREQASFENLEVQVERYRQLHAESLISIQELQDLESRLRAATAQVALAEAQVAQAEASLNDLKVQQGYSKVHSPLAGFTGTRFLDPGALVNPNLPIVSVIDVSRLKTVVPVPEVAIKDVRIGLSAEVTVDAYSGRKYFGRITRISPLLDSDTRTGDIEIVINNQSGELKPGMLARVSIEASQPQSVLAIPRGALLTRGFDKGVFVLTDELTTHYRSIRIGRIQGDQVEVLEGLEPDTPVVASGAQKLNEGDKVRLK
jgi:RND family efflux transporter MFP subunit